MKHRLTVLLQDDGVLIEGLNKTKISSPDSNSSSFQDQLEMSAGNKKYGLSQGEQGKGGSAGSATQSKGTPSDWASWINQNRSDGSAKQAYTGYDVQGNAHKMYRSSPSAATSVAGSNRPKTSVSKATSFRNTGNRGFAKIKVSNIVPFPSEPTLADYILRQLK